jgi:hypothetical protein
VLEGEMAPDAVTVAQEEEDWVVNWDGLKVPVGENPRMAVEPVRVGDPELNKVGEGDKLVEVVADLLSMGLTDGVREAIAVVDDMLWISARIVRGTLTRVSSVSGDVAETTMEIAMTPRVPAGTLASAASGSSTVSKPDTSFIENTPVTFASERKYEYVRPGAS